MTRKRQGAILHGNGWPGGGVDGSVGFVGLRVSATSRSFPVRGSIRTPPRSGYSIGFHASWKFLPSPKGSARGESCGQFQAGWSHEAGNGIEVDYVPGAFWYRRAADNGNAAAQTNLGMLYAKGLGVERNDAEAFKWTLRAAADGYPPAQTNMGWLYASGQRIPCRLPWSNLRSARVEEPTSQEE